MKRLITLFYLGIASAFSQPDYVIPSPLILSEGKTRVTIPQRNSEGVYDWYSASCRGGIETSVLHAAIKKDEILYLLFTCEGWSKGGENRNGRCGAGWEKQINWMAIKDGKVISHQRRDLTSCWVDVDGSITGWKHGKFSWNSEERDGFYECFFDEAQPEQGIQIKTFEKHPENTEQGA